MADTCQKINDALKKEKDVDNNTLIEITTSGKQKDLVSIAQEYQTKFGVAITKDFEDKLKSDFRDLMITLYTDPIERAAENIYKAMKGLGCNNETLMREIIPRPTSLLRKIQEKYKEKYNKEMIDDIKDETKKTFQAILVAILTNERSKNKSPDEETCKKIAQELYDNGEKNKSGTEEEVFIKYLTECSPHELLMISREYHKISGSKTLYEAIDSEFGGDECKALKNILFSLITPAQYLANEILTAIKGAGTNEENLNKAVLMAENCMDKVKKYYEQINNVNMGEDILGDVSGAYGKLLMYLLNEKEKGDSV